MAQNVVPEKYKVLVYALEKRGLAAPWEQIDVPKCTLSFGSYDSAARFQEFDGVILFQGVFESFEVVKGYSSSTLSHEWDRNELDKRTKETFALLDHGGWVCFLLDRPFKDFGYRGEDYRKTDLVKRLLNARGIDRGCLRERSVAIRSHVNEFRDFFDLYGGAWNVLTPGHGSGAKTIASGPDGPVAVVSLGSVFFIPTLLPDSGKAEEFFRLLAVASLSVRENLRDEVPDWADEFKLPGEVGILSKKKALLEEITRADGEMNRLRNFKKVLVAQGELLVDAVTFVLGEGLGLSYHREEAFREDLQLRNAEGQCVALVEVKGTSRGVQREHVNQADSHRERAGCTSSFPSILIINTNLKAASLAEKDRAVAAEQVQHAARNNVLILRTLDLLNLAAMRLAGQIDVAAVTAMLTTSAGWLKVTDGQLELRDK